MDDEEAFAIAERMGLEGYFTASGDDGTVVFLEDGRVLKLTASRIEASLCLALMDLQRDGRRHPAVPEIHGVFAFEEMVDLRPLADAVRPLRKYAIVRESFDDQMMPGASREDYVRLSLAWVTGDEPFLAAVAAGAHGPEMASVLSGVRWVRDNTGFSLRDISLSNVGESASGAVGMRDFGRCDVDAGLARRAELSDLPPPFTQSPSPSP